MYLPLYKVADTPFHIQGDELRDSVKAMGMGYTLLAAHETFMQQWPHVRVGNFVMLVQY